MKFSKLIVLAVVILNAVFTAAILYVFLKTDGDEPTSLVTAWFAFTTTELFSLSRIKVNEIKKIRRISKDE